MADLNLPTPLVDNYWTDSDNKVFTDIVNRVPQPKTLNNDRDEFINLNCQVAQAVHSVKMGADRKRPAYMYDAISELDGVPQNWFKDNKIAPLFDLASDSAKYVISDNPGALHRNIDTACAAKTNPLIFNKNPLDGSHFHRTIISRDALSAHMAYLVNPTSFRTKYKFAVPRPNAIIASILDGDIVVDNEILREVKMCTDFKLIEQKGKEYFTLVPNTTPSHWSYPAMHSTNAGTALLRAACFWQFEPTGSTTINIRRASVTNAFSRMELGVHTFQDNLIGLSLGQAIAFQELPNIMKEYAEADPDEVRAYLTPFLVNYGEYHISTT